jgi:hypothetical protein
MRRQLWLGLVIVPLLLLLLLLMVVVQCMAPRAVRLLMAGSESGTTQTPTHPLRDVQLRRLDSGGDHQQPLHHH